MTQYALMMTCRAGTRSLTESPLSWHDDMHTITVSGHETKESAYAELLRLRPVGFNRDRIRLWVTPWNERFS